MCLYSYLCKWSWLGVSLAKEGLSREDYCIPGKVWLVQLSVQVEGSSLARKVFQERTTVHMVKCVCTVICASGGG